MKWIPGLRAQLLLLRRNAAEERMNEEIRFHLEMETEKYIREGLPPGEAGRRAVLAFGGVEGHKESLRDGRRLRRLEDLWLDVRFAVRTLRRSPITSAVAVVSLAVGLAVNATAFALFDALLLRTVAVPEPGQLVHVYGKRAEGERQMLFSFQDYEDFRARSAGVVSELVAWNKATVAIGEEIPPAALQGDYTLPSRFRFAIGRIVSGNYFHALGGTTALGRPLTWNDDRPGQPPVVVVGDGFWRRHLGADPGVIGRTLTLQGTPFTIVGVARAGFTGTEAEAADFWVPLSVRGAIVQSWRAADWRVARDAEVLSLLARVRPGVGHDRARRVLSSIAGELALEYPAPERAVAVTLESAATVLPRTAVTTAAAASFLTAVLLILLIACANVASILIAQAAQRQREIGIRLAIGAARSRLVRQLVTESLVLSTIAGALGLVLTVAVIRIAYPPVLAALPLPKAMIDAFAMDLSPSVHVYAYAFLLACGAGAALGLLPAVYASRTSLTAVMKDQGAVLRGAGRPSRLREALVASQVALCVLLLATAALLVRSMAQVSHVDPGFATDGVFMVSAGVRSPTPDPAREAELRRRITERLAAMPGVRSVTFAARAPLNGSLPTLEVAAGRVSATVSYNRIGANYFEALDQSLFRGRPMTEAEARSGAAVALVNEAAAQQLWPGGTAIGQLVAVRRSPDAVPVPAEVIGIVRNARSNLIWRRDGPTLYLPPEPDGTGVLLVRTRGLSPHALAFFAPQVEERAGTLDRGAVVSVQRLDASLAIQLGPFRGLAVAASLLGIIGLGLAVVGVYGIMAFAVARRRREISIRIALGASARDILGTTLGRGAAAVLVGLVAGSVLAAAGSAYLRSVLVEVSPSDPISFGAVALIVSLTGLLAAVAPARRALHSDPAAVLRAE